MLGLARTLVPHDDCLVLRREDPGDAEEVEVNLNRASVDREGVTAEGASTDNDRKGGQRLGRRCSPVGHVNRSATVILDAKACFVRSREEGQIQQHGMTRPHHQR